MAVAFKPDWAGEDEVEDGEIEETEHTIMLPIPILDTSSSSLGLRALRHVQVSFSPVVPQALHGRQGLSVETVSSSDVRPASSTNVAPRPWTTVMTGTVRGKRFQ